SPTRQGVQSHRQSAASSTNIGPLQISNGAFRPRVSRRRAMVRSTIFVAFVTLVSATVFAQPPIDRVQSAIARSAGRRANPRLDGALARMVEQTATAPALEVAQSVPLA